MACFSSEAVGCTIVQRRRIDRVDDTVVVFLRPPGLKDLLCFKFPQLDGSREEQCFHIRSMCDVCLLTSIIKSGSWQLPGAPMLGVDGFQSSSHIPTASSTN